MRLENSLFHVKPIFAKYMLQIVKMCETHLGKLELIPVRAHGSYTVTDFNNNFGSGASSHRRVIKQKLTEVFHSLVDGIKLLL